MRESIFKFFSEEIFLWIKQLSELLIKIILWNLSNFRKEKWYFTYKTNYFRVGFSISKDIYQAELWKSSRNSSNLKFNYNASYF